ncbi:MAG: hypothetical protein DRJ68_01440 [Thermoprotei archaeon]|nr:MAG: hypothetical protein DRJ68_01440 [Thermoprotei archaeon]
MKARNIEEALRRVQEEVIAYITKLVPPEELLDVNVSLQFDQGVLDVDVEVRLHEASFRNPVPIARRAVEYAIKLFESLWGGGIEGSRALNSREESP